MRLIHRIFICQVFCLAAWGQELQVSSLVLSRGESGSLRISVSSPPGKAPAALEWDLVFPIAQVTIEDSSWSAGEAATAAGKELTCVRQLKKQTEEYAYKCIIAGRDQSFIGNGTAAVVRISIPVTARGGTAVLNLEKVLGASAQGKKLDVNATGGTITIRGREARHR